VETTGLEDKIKYFYEYLSQEPTPEIGASNKALKNVFACHMYNELTDSETPEIVSALNAELQLLTNSEPDSVLNLLKTLGIERSSGEKFLPDWWPYIITYRLTTDPTFANVFIEAITTYLDENDDIKLGTLIMDVLHAYGDAIPDEISASSDLGKTINCFTADTGGILASFVSKIEGFDELHKLISAIEEDSLLKNVTENALGKGINTLLLRWRSNDSVRDLIDYYRTNIAFEALRDAFFETNYAETIENCVKTGPYADVLVKKWVNAIRFEMIKDFLRIDNGCNTDTADIVLELIQTLRTNNQIKREVEIMVMNFIHDFLYIENTLSSASGSAETPFNDYYAAQLGATLVETGDLIVEIYRDSEYLTTMENPTVTNYTDENVPVNTTDKTEYHEYFIKAKTTIEECNQVQSNTGKAQVDPQLKEGTDINVTADISLKIKEGFSELFMEKLRDLLATFNDEETHEVTPTVTEIIYEDQFVTFDDWEMHEAAPTVTEIMHEEQCGNAKFHLEYQILSGKSIDADLVFNYILFCYGEPYIDHKIIEKRTKIVPPVLMKLKFAQYNLDDLRDIDVDFMVGDLIYTFIDEIYEQLQTEANIETRISGLSDIKTTLLAKMNINDLTDEEKQLIKCGGALTCSQDTENKIRDYFAGSSHTSKILVEVYDDPNGEPILRMPAQTDIFGEIDDLSLGVLEAWNDYTIKVRLPNQKFVLPKISTITLTSGTPAGTAFKATIDLVYTQHFRYGDFNENDQIDIDDIRAWGEILTLQPELWADTNLDGLRGIDLFDALALQQNWGVEMEAAIEEEKISLFDLVSLFGISLHGIGEGIVDRPSWLHFVEGICTE